MCEPGSWAKEQEGQRRSSSSETGLEGQHRRCLKRPHLLTNPHVRSDGADLAGSEKVLPFCLQVTARSVFALDSHDPLNDCWARDHLQHAAHGH